MEPSEPVPLTTYREYPRDEMHRRAGEFYRRMNRRRTVRHFSERSVPQAIIADCLRTAGTAPSGAHMQPWSFVAVSDAVLKRRIRAAAEAVERRFYEQRIPEQWRNDLRPLKTDWHKPFLESAPWLIAVFAQKYRRQPGGGRKPHYYVTESVSIAVGFLLAALHHAGLTSLTYTPAPMGFLKRILGRPDNERPLMIVVTGYPAVDVRVPDLPRKPLEEIASFI